MSNHDNEKIAKQSQEEVVVSKNIAVSFNDSRHSDDLKSTAINLFRKKEKKKKAELVWPLKDINFTGYQGEILGIIGSNGAGKTTLSKIITGILQQDEGTMHVDGNVTALFSFGMGFNKELTGRENVYLNGMMLGINKQLINDYIEDIHEFSEIGQFFDQPMKYYSSGMKARLGFSVASHLQPEILILDEALNTGDVKFGSKAAEKLKQLVANAKMVIIVTHSLRYAQKNCDRLIWLDNGYVKEIGDPKTVIEHYKETVPVVARKKQKRSLNVSKTETTVGKKTVVKAENVGVSFRLQNKKEDYWALRNVNFDIKEGEVVGIIGHNGAGKSTLCKAITNILKPDEGTLTVTGQTSSLLGYGTGFNAQLTGADNIFLNAMLLGIPKERVAEKFDEIIEFSGIKKAIDKPVKHYSAGMKSRLGFSIAAILKPDVFIVDEALSTGDLAFQEKASLRIQEMMEHAKAVIIVSHSMGFVEKVCTRGIWMEQGQVKFDGAAEEAVAKYREAMGVKKKAVKQNKNKGTAKARPKQVTVKKSVKAETAKPKAQDTNKTGQKQTTASNNMVKAEAAPPKAQAVNKYPQIKTAPSKKEAALETETASNPKQNQDTQKQTEQVQTVGLKTRSERRELLNKEIQNEAYVEETALPKTRGERRALQLRNLREQIEKEESFPKSRADRKERRRRKLPKQTEEVEAKAPKTRAERKTLNK